MPYPKTGPFNAGAAPGISAAFLNNVETWLGTALQADGDVNGTAQTFTGTVTANALVATGATSTITAINIGPAGGPYGLISWLAGETSLYLNTPQSGAANWLEFGVWNGSILKVPFGIGSAASAHITSYIDDAGNYNGGANCGIPTTRNAVATSVPIFTGTTTPTGAIPVGSLWFDQ